MTYTGELVVTVLALTVSALGMALLGGGAVAIAYYLWNREKGDEE